MPLIGCRPGACDSHSLHPRLGMEPGHGRAPQSGELPVAHKPQAQSEEGPLPHVCLGRRRRPVALVLRFALTAWACTCSPHTLPWTMLFSCHTSSSDAGD